MTADKKKPTNFSKEEVIFRGHIFDIVRGFYKDQNGNSVTRDIVSHSGAVVILPIANNGEIVFIKQYRHAISDYLLEIPAGTLEDKENVLDCAKRELREETGLGADDWVELGLIYPAPGFCDEVQHSFLAKNLNYSPLKPDDDEIIEVLYLSLSEAKEKIRNGTIVDAKTIATIYKAELLRLI